MCLVSLTGCVGNSPASPSPVDREIVLAPGEAAAIARGLSIRFIGVLGDSRCPADAMCVLGGDATVRIEIHAGAQAAKRDLHTGNMQPVTYDGLRVELVQLDPYPFSARPIQPEDYRATLRITR
jgi:hypothetical protein